MDETQLVDVWDDMAAEIAARPGVRGVTPTAFSGVSLTVDGDPISFFTPILGAGIGDDPPANVVVLNGRMPNSSSSDEIVLNEESARLTGAAVGDVIELRSFAADQFDAFVGSQEAADRGPRVDVEVVGIVRGSEDVSDTPEPIAYLPDGFRDRYRDEIVMCDCALAVNTDPRDVESVMADIETTLAGRPMVVENYDIVTHDRVSRAVGLEVGALWIASVIAGIAAVLVMTQAVARHIVGRRRSASALGAIGVTRPELTRAWILILVPVAVIGAAGAVVISIALSPLFPRGLARRAEPDLGLRVDAPVALLGALVVVLITLVTVAAVALTTSGRSNARRSESTPGRTAAWASGLRPPATLGVSMAVDPARDRSRLATTSAVLAMALAIAGALAVTMIDRSASEVLDTPRAFGTDWDLELNEEPDDPEAMMEATLAEPIEAMSFQYSVGGTDFRVVGPTGSDLAQPFAFDDQLGSIGPFIDDGRPPNADDDVAIGARLAARIGAEVGDDITLEPTGATFHVAGIGRANDGDDTDVFVVMTMDGLDRLGSASGEPQLTGALVRVGDAGDDAVQRLLDLGWQPTTPPSKVGNLGQIGSVPRLLAGALAVLGLAGIAHALLIAVTRGRGDIAVARALGFTSRQARVTIVWQGVATTVAAIVIGVPMGILIGRVVWKRVADGVGALDLVSIPWLAFVAIPATALGAVTVAAWIIGRRAATFHPAAVLRSE